MGVVLNHLWAPWRMQYVTKADDIEGCVFCACLQEGGDEANGILARARHSFVILNAFPYSSGHLMIVPYEHQNDLSCLPPEALAEMMTLAQIAVRVLHEQLRTEGANIGMNIGKAAGAGVKDHLHLHVVPRWAGDTNFMTTLSETRVVPQSLPDTWACLAPVLMAAVAEAGLACD